MSKCPYEQIGDCDCSVGHLEQLWPVGYESRSVVSPTPHFSPNIRHGVWLRFAQRLDERLQCLRGSLCGYEVARFQGLHHDIRQELRGSFLWIDRSRNRPFVASL